MREHGVGGPGADNSSELLARGATNAGDAAERGQQRLPPPRADPGDVVELRPQIAERARLAVECHREAMRLVADPLDQQQRRALVRAARSRRLGRA